MRTSLPRYSRSQMPQTDDPRVLPPWLSVETRRVVVRFLDWLARAHGWQRIYLVSPWMSEIRAADAISLANVVKRLRDDRCTLYVVTRPPEEDWHWRVLEAFRESGRANVSLVKDLHTKLFCADTTETSFAMIGSANFTQKSLANRELGVMVRARGEGTPLVRALLYEAADIYRSSTGRQVWCRQRFGGR